MIAPLLAEGATHEVIVVVDGCQDGSVELVEDFASIDPRVIGVYQPHQGAAAARMTGVRRATGEIVLLLDDDVEAEAGLVDGHSTRHREQEGLVVVGYMPVAAMSRRGTQDLATRLYSSAYEQSCRNWDDEPDEILKTLWAGNVSVRRADALRIGMQGAARFAHHEDRDFGLRCRAAGLQGVFDRSLRARHHYERTLAGLVRDARDHGHDMTLLHLAHPDALGQLRRDRFTALLPAPFVRLVAFSGRPRATTLVSSGLIGLVQLAGLLRLPRTQERAALVLIRIERQRGAAELRRRRLEQVH
ncbi:MAG: hypothetical protein QOG15_739 [Solirubrobacteraceae bacterium]|nr:hypothetical protein [Solirubrobacteraceae bacterium]